MSNGSERASPSATSHFELHGGNYQDWRFRMQMHLVRLGLWDVVSGTAPRPDDGALDEQRDWDQRSLLALAEMIEHLGDVDVVLVRRCASAREAWEQLAAMYEPSGLACQVFLARELEHARMSEGDSPRAHLARMAALAEQLATAGRSVADDSLAHALLASLPPSYAPLVDELIRRENDLTTALVVSSVLREDARRRLEGATVPPAQYEDVIRPFFAPSLPPPELPSRQPSPGPAALPSRFSATSTPSSESSFSAGSGDDDSAGVRIFFPLAGPFRRDGWYLHSSAAHHISPKRTAFARFEDLPPGELVEIAGRTYDAAGAGDVRVVWDTGDGATHRVLMRNVYYVPAAPASFIAVNPLVAKGLGFAFRDGHCNVEAQPGVTMGRAIREGGTYRLLTQ